MAKLLLLSLVAVALLALSTVWASDSSGSDSTSEYEVNFHYGLKILATDGVNLTADGYSPIPKTAGERFPVIIFPNSWSTPEIEYITRCQYFAKRGYVTVEYQTRGWFLSGGRIDTAGPLDRDDTSTLIQFVKSMADEWNANTSRIAFGGISYGAGISLMAAGHNPEVTTAVAMSGWDQFDNGFYYYKTPSQSHMDGLISIAKEDGRVNPNLLAYYAGVTTHQNMTDVHEFARNRSPERLYLDKYNDRKTPIFLSNNVLDRLFYPQTKIHFYSRLQGPKFQLINQGFHAEPEALGILIHENYIWHKVHQWLDYWLKDIDSGIMDEPPIQVQCGDSIFAQNYTKFTAWPDPVKADPMTLYFGSRGNAMYGTLDAMPPNSTGEMDSIRFSKETGLGEGDDKDASFGDWTTFDFPEVSSNATSVVYRSEPFAEDTELCGNPTANNLTVTVPADGQWQIYAYLYDMSSDDVGAVIGDGMYTSWGDDSQEKVVSDVATVVKQLDGTNVVTIDTLYLRTMCRVFKAGHRFAMAFVLYNDGYSHAKGKGLVVGFNSGASSVTLPRVTNP